MQSPLERHPWRHGSNQQRYVFLVAKLSADGDWLWANQYDLYRLLHVRHLTCQQRWGCLHCTRPQPPPRLRRTTDFRRIVRRAAYQRVKDLHTVSTKRSFAWLKSFNTNHTSSTTAKFVILDIATNVQGDVYFEVCGMRAETVLKQTMNCAISYNRSGHDRGFVANDARRRLLWASTCTA